MAEIIAQKDLVLLSAIAITHSLTLEIIYLPKAACDFDL